MHADPVEDHFAALRARLRAAYDQHDVEDWTTTTALRDVVDEWVATAATRTPSGGETFGRLALGVLLVELPYSWRTAEVIKGRLDEISSTAEADARGSLAPAVARAWRRVLDDVDVLDRVIQQDLFARLRRVAVAATPATGPDPAPAGAA